MITLSSDFGSPYPAAMKGVILQESDARLVDISHEFPRQDVRAGAFWLREVLPYFPPAVHCVVIDPGVGTDREAVVVRAGDHAFVGPDNGVLLPVARELGDPEVFAVDHERPESVTFHGRDVFAPTAASVHEAGVDSFEAELDCRPLENYEDCIFPDPTDRDDGIDGSVLVVDDFGNAITNIPGSVLDGRFGESATANGAWAPIRRTYAAVESGNRLVTVGSHGNVELAVNQGRGDKRFAVSSGSKVKLRWT